MPWTETNYPAAFRNLAALVRTKAIEIANTLLAEQHDEQTAITMALIRAKKWAEQLNRFVRS